MQVNCFTFLLAMEPSEPAFKKRKGGIWQRQQKAANELQVESALYALLMVYFAKGLMSGALVHAIAQAAQKDLDQAQEGFKVTKLNKIASLQRAKNFGPSLTAMMAKEASLPKPLEVHIPMKGASPDQPSSSILLPHEMFASYFAKVEAWTRCILPDVSKVKLFWNNFKDHPLMANHPCKKNKNWMDTTLPLGLHGDEVPVLGVGKIWCKAVLSFSWFSILACASGLGFEDAHIYVWGVFEKYCVDTTGAVLGTMHTFWLIMQWSFSALATGKWPHRDWRGQLYAPSSPEGQKAGQPLAGGYSAVLVQVAGDPDFFSKWMETPRVTGHDKPCVLCKCTYYGPCSWLDNRPNSLWQRSMVQPSNYRSHWSPTGALYKLAGFSNMCLAMDFMHCMHLGWLQHFYGSVLSILVHFILPQEPLQNLETLGLWIKTHQRNHRAKHPYRMKLDKLTMIQPKKGYPKLRGRASDIAGLAHCLLDLWMNFMDHTNQQHQQIKLFLKLNLELKNALETFGPSFGHMAIPAEQFEKVFNAGLTMAQLHSQLSSFFEEDGKQLFNMTTKTHFALHSLQFSRYIHPFLVWCYKGESTMHRVQILWKSCLHGSKHWQAAKKAAWKERHLLWLQGKL